MGVTDRFWAIQLWVQVEEVVSHFANGNPVLAVKREAHKSEAVVCGSVQDEAHDVLNYQDTYIPESGVEKKQSDYPALCLFAS